MVSSPFPDKLITLTRPEARAGCELDARDGCGPSSRADQIRDDKGMETNELGQPVGDVVPGWQVAHEPTAPVLTGQFCRLERLDPDRHAEQLFAADSQDVNGASWTYLPYGPFATRSAYQEWVTVVSTSADPLFYAVIATDPLIDQGASTAAGVLSYLRITPTAGSIEVGHIHLSPLLQQRRAATEAQFLLMEHAFDDLGYRRYEWKCDALNAPSCAAASRLGFSYEGTFRQAAVVKGRNRDTAWYSVTDVEWPRVQRAFTAWLSPENFDEYGLQRAHLQARVGSPEASTTAPPDGAA